MDFALSFFNMIGLTAFERAESIIPALGIEKIPATLTAVVNRSALITAKTFLDGLLLQKLLAAIFALKILSSFHRLIVG